jgi:hypothetical protein
MERRSIPARIEFHPKRKKRERERQKGGDKKGNRTSNEMMEIILRPNRKKLE